MRIIDENLYRRLTQLRRRGFSTSEILAKGIEAFEQSKKISYKLNYRPCGVHDSFTYRWPSRNMEKFDRAECYDVLIYGNRRRFYIAYGYRWAFGENRKRIIVFIEKGTWKNALYPLVEFCGTDDYSNTLEVSSFIKRPDGKFMKLSDVAMYPEYSSLANYVRDHSEVIHGGRKGFATLTVKEDDVAKMIYHAVIQGRWRGKL